MRKYSLLLAASCALQAGCGADEPSLPEPVGYDEGLPVPPIDSSSSGPDDEEPSVPPLSSCDFDYEMAFDEPESQADAGSEAAFVQWYRGAGDEAPGVDAIVHPEPAPPFMWSADKWQNLDGVTLPGYSDDMPLFSRASAWDGGTRCYEMPTGARYLSEAEAYAQYLAMAEKTTGAKVDTTEGVRSVVGIRGAYPGTFQWHGNRPNQFNDTLVLLWRQDDQAHVREFPVNTDTGAVYFGYHSASSLRPNRRYRYKNGWHRKYNAPQMDEWAYRVADDSNGNGHWDRDRNGWLGGGALDHEREGGAHNIHMASVNAPLGEAKVANWSAGCQVIPGMENWLGFMEDAWTGKGDGVDYFLLDARDIAPTTWTPCEPDGSHACPFVIPSFPFVATGNTAKTGVSEFDTYSCSEADESGPELVYVFTVQREGRLEVKVNCEEPVDIDIHLLDGDDPQACLARDHSAFGYDLSPGRYFIVADTWVDASVAKSGSFELKLSFE